MTKKEEYVSPFKEYNIYKRMLSIESSLQTVAKNLSVSTGKNSYKAVSERDVIDAVKPIESLYNVYSYPFSREIVESGILEKTDQYGTKKSFFVRMKTVYRFVNVDNPTEYIDITSYGTGIDTGDKAEGKAQTYSDKYALMKAYKISTGEDPDQEASKEYDDYKRADKKSKKTMTDEQYNAITRLYTDEEIKTMVERQGKTDIREFTQEQAVKMIEARTEHIDINSKEDTF